MNKESKNTVHSFNVHEAEKYGAECAVLLYNIRWWLEKNRANRKHIREGRVWTYNSTKAFSELFPYLSEKQIWRRLKKLEDDGILLSEVFNKNPHDRTKWYSIDEDYFRISESEKCDFPKKENEDSEKGNSLYTDINTDDKPDDSSARTQELFSEDEKYAIPDIEEVQEYFKTNDRIPADQVKNEAEKFVLYWEEQEWKRGGKRIKSWKRLAATWAINYEQFDRGGKKGLDSGFKPSYHKEITFDD